MARHLIQKVTKVADLDKLKEIISGTLGATCWRASLSYGDELRLHIGTRLPYSQQAMAEEERGSWMLGTRGSPWMLECLSETLTTSEDDPEMLKRKLHHVEGSTIVAFETSYPDLAATITFNNKCKLALLPSTEDDFGLPHWELFTPYMMLLKVGPGAVWSYVRSDLPESL